VAGLSPKLSLAPWSTSQLQAYAHTAATLAPANSGYPTTQPNDVLCGDETGLLPGGRYAAMLTSRTSRKGRMMSGTDWRDVDQVALRRRAEAGEAAAMHNLGIIAYYERDAEAAIGWFREAASRGDIESMYNLGVVLSGLGRAAEAEPWHIAAAMAGDGRAMSNLAVFYNLQRRLDSARYWYEKSEAAGYSPDDDNTGLPDDVRSSFMDKGRPR
jgi:TPR repeat protein